MDPASGQPVAGPRSPDGRRLLDLRPLVVAGTFVPEADPGESTTLGVVATNARLTQAQAEKMAQMAHDGLARTIYPAHLPLDGDTIFALATGVHPGTPDLNVIGALAAEVMARAILRAALQASGLPGLPAARDLTTAPAH